ncbi:Nn.00g096320.m01.CDS01 [Neocucurbitaria sp. VM-36]
MGDPLSVAGSIAGLLSIADVVFRKVYHYVKTVKNAEKEILSLKSEVAALTGVLHNLHLVAEELEDDSTISNATKIDYVASCSATLKRIEGLLSKIQFSKDERYQNAIQRLKWPIKTTEIVELGDEVRRHRETLSLALSADTMVALLQCLSSQKSIIGRLDGIQVALQQSKDFQLGISLDEDRRRILKSFLTVEPRPYYEKSLELRYFGTGSWLYKNDTFQSWLHEPGSRLWLTGIPGAGKTVLSGMMIQECLARASSTEAIAYYYCDYNNIRSQDIINIFSALAAQIAAKNESSFTLLRGYYNQLHSRDQMERQPKIEELISLIQDMASDFSDVRLIVDGLDECGEAMVVAAESLQKLVCAPRATISLALLSREEQAIRNIINEDGTYGHIEIAAQREDIESYVQSEIEMRMQKRRLRIRSEELKLLIVQELVSKAGGMFRWVACQLDHLCDLATDSQRRKALKELPKDLKETYERILLRIKKPVAPLVTRTLQWLAYATPKLEVDALLEALSIDDNSDVLDPEARPTEEDLLIHCGSLIRKTGSHLEIAHFTVLEYLETLSTEHAHLSQFRLNQDSKAVLAKTSLSYLCMPVFDMPATTFFEEIESFREEYPFHSHASNAWAGYMENSWGDVRLCQLYRRLFDPKKTPNFFVWAVQRFMGERTVEEHGSVNHVSSLSKVTKLVFDIQFRPLHAAATFGLRQVCQWLLDQGGDVNLPSSLGSPLQLCICTMLRLYTQAGLPNFVVDESESSTTALLLLESGAHADDLGRHTMNGVLGLLDNEENYLKAVESFQTHAAKPLSKAHNTMSDNSFYARLSHCIASDQVERVKDLMKDQRIALNYENPDQPDLLMFAATQGAVQVMNLLLDLGFDPASRDVDDDDNVLYHCLHLEDDEILSRLLAFPGVTRPTNDGRTIWHVSAAAGALRVLKLLVELQSGIENGLSHLYDGKTPLEYAIDSGNESCSLLLAQAMQVQGLAINDLAVLRSCIVMGLCQVLLQLVKDGCDIRAVTESHRSVWFFVTRSTTIELFKMLLSTGLDPLSQDATGKTAFHALLDGTRHTDIQKGVEIDSQNLIDYDILTLRLDVVTEPMLEHLLTPLSAKIKDNEGNTIWFYFCTKYIPRIIQKQNHHVYDYLEGLVRHLVSVHAVEAYDSQNGGDGVELFIENCLDAFEEATDMCERLIVRLLNVFFSCEDITLPTRSGVLTRALVWSIRQRETTIFEMLLNCGVDVHACDITTEGLSALGTSARGYGDFKMFPKILEHADKGRLDETDGTGYAPIHAVCDSNEKSYRSPMRLRSLLEAGASPDTGTRDDNRTALHLAARNNFVDGLQALLEHNADLNLRDYNGWDILAFAVSGGEIIALNLLESHVGNDPSAPRCERRYAYRGIFSGCTLFHLATINDGVEMLEHLRTSEHGKYMHDRAKDDETPLHFAVYHNAEKCVEWLMKNGANINAKVQKEQRTPLHYAVEMGHFTIVRLLVSAGAQYLEDEKGKRPFDLVPNGGEEKLFDALQGLHALSDLASLDLLSSADIQPFFTAIRKGDLAACLTLMRKSPHIVSVPSIDCGLCTPLIHALTKAPIKVVTELLKSGATIAGYRCSKHSSSDRDTCGASSFELAVRRTDLNLKLPLLLEMWSRQQDGSWYGFMPVHIAAAFNPEAIDILHDHLVTHKERYTDIEFHQPTDFRPDRYITIPKWGLWDAPPLHIAAHNKQSESVTRLLSHGADVHSRDSFRSTALHIAVKKDCPEIVEILLAHDADPDARDQLLRTPLILCADRARIDIAKVLLARGADKHARDCHGETVIYQAAKNGRLEIFVFLIEAGCDPAVKVRPGRDCALASALKHPHMATYIYAKGFSLEHLIPFEPEDYPLVHWRQKYLKRLLRYLPMTSRVKMINRKTTRYANALVIAASNGDTSAMRDLIQAGADIEFVARNGWGSALIAACTIDQFEAVKCLVYYGANFESTVDGKPITALQAARHSPRLVQWLLVGRHTEQQKLTNFPAQKEQDIKCWSGIRQLEIKLDGFYKRSHRTACQSYLEYVCWIYGQKDSWRQMVPYGWKPEEHFAALPGEQGHPLEARFLRRVRSGYEECLENYSQCHG